MLIAEDLLLLVTDDDTGKPIVGSTELDHALAGAILLELALTQRVDLAESERRFGHKQGLVVIDGSPTGDVLLDDAIRHIDAKPGRKSESVVGSLRKGLRADLYERLADRGILRVDKGKVLGLFPTTRWPAVDSTHEAQLRQALYDTLVAGAEPPPPVAAVISLLHAIRAVPKVAEVAREDKKRVQARAKEIAEGAWAADAVRRAVDSVNAATMAAVTAATVAGVTAAGS